MQLSTLVLPAIGKVLFGVPEEYSLAGYRYTVKSFRSFSNPSRAYEILVELGQNGIDLGGNGDFAKSKKVQERINGFAKSASNLEKEQNKLSRVMWDFEVRIGNIITDPNDSFRVFVDDNGNKVDERKDRDTIRDDFSVQASRIQYSLDWHNHIKGLLIEYKKLLERE